MLPRGGRLPKHLARHQCTCAGLCRDVWVPVIEIGLADVCGIRIERAIPQIFFAIATRALFAACATTRPAQISPPPSAIAVPQPTPTPQVVGMASWYGPGFHGHKTAAGGIYDQEDLTAASIAFPLGSRVMVTNLDNGRSVEVTITDRGPFMKGRKIDLSHKAARMIGMLDRAPRACASRSSASPPGPATSARRCATASRSVHFPSNRTPNRCATNWPHHYADVRVVDVLDADASPLLPCTYGRVRDSIGRRGARVRLRPIWISSCNHHRMTSRV